MSNIGYDYTHRYRLHLYMENVNIIMRQSKNLIWFRVNHNYGEFVLIMVRI